MTSGPAGLPLTKPVRHARQRPTPRWVGWFLILVPTLAAGGSLLGIGSVSAFRIAILVLFVTAAWDWWRFQDRSRTFYVTLALAAAFLLAGVVALAWSRPPIEPAIAELIAVVGMFALALALVQLYRTAETVLTIARGWLYLLFLVVAEAAWEIGTGNRLPTFHLPPEARGVDPGWDLIAGPFIVPDQLAAACCVAMLVMPVGFAFEHDRRLRWAYPAACLPVPWVIAHTGSNLALLVALVTLGVWASLHRWSRLVALPLGLVALVALPQGRTFLSRLVADFAHLVGGETAGAWGDRLNLMLDGVVMLRRSLWLGVGPGGFAHVMETQWLPFGTNGLTRPFSAIVEITAQYGLSLFVVCTLVAVGAMRWCVQRLLATRGQPLMSPQRVVAWWLLVTLALWPLTSMMSATWLAQPVSTLQFATIAMLARHIERPKGRLVMPSEAALRHLPPGPGAATAPID